MLTAGIDIGHESVNVALVDDDGLRDHATFVIAGELRAAVAARAFAQPLRRGAEGLSVREDGRGWERTLRREQGLGPSYALG